jgi:Concanavalin A-like lectin/glucanases superfamily/Domain of unknown function (DUF2341)
MAARLHTLAICGLAGCHFSAGPTHDDASNGRDGTQGGTAHHKVIGIRPTALTGSLENFPLWIDLVDADLAAHATADGSDIYFTLADGTKLDFELEQWDTHTGALSAWVRIPSLDVSTQLELHYGDPSNTKPPKPTGVFAAYESVWHMSDPLTGSLVTDSTGQRNGAAQGLDPSAHVVGKLAGAIVFNGANQVSFTNPLLGSSPHTISAWVRQAAPGNGAFDSVITLGSTQQSAARFLDSRYTAAGVAVGFFNNDWTNTGVGVTNNTWVLLHWVFGGSNRKSQLYANGVLTGEFVHQQGINTVGATGILGNAPQGSGPNVGFPGLLDEVRISSTVLTAAWIGAEFDNQADPAHFYTVGDEQSP